MMHFDLNDYIVPHQYVGQTLVIEASLERIRIIDGIKVVAEHERSFDRAKQIERAAHIDALYNEHSLHNLE